LEAEIPDLPEDQPPALSEEAIEGLEATTRKSNKRKRDGADASAVHAEAHIDNEQNVKARRLKITTEEGGGMAQDQRHTVLGTKPQDTTGEGAISTAIDEDADDKQPRRSKKERKAERKALEAAAKSKELPVAARGLLPEPAKASDDSTPEDKKPKKNNRNREKKRLAKASTGVEAKDEGKPPRFIVFIGTHTGTFLNCLYSMPH